ncbi:MAG TPA: hypothetical protein VHF47_00295 [Acidimicrobiales bacterium]|nr:hypothetical protein [Acidimicrobiales bacterium]
MSRPSVRLLLFLAGLLPALTLLHGADAPAGGSLSPSEPAALLFTPARWVALATGWYLVATTLVGVLARLGRLRSLVRLADRITVPAVRRLLDASLGLSVLVASVAVTSPASADRGPVGEEAPPPTMLRLPDDPADRPPPPSDPPTSVDPGPEPDLPAAEPTTSWSAPAVEVPASTTSPTNTTTPAPSTTTTTTGPPTPTTTTSAAGAIVTSPAHGPSPGLRAEPDGPPPAPPPGGDTWTVERGDHFWSIAERVLTDAWQRPPTDAETDPYWRVLVEANRDRLADRDNPDLLFAGQVLAVPAPPTRAPP